MLGKKIKSREKEEVWLGDTLEIRYVRNAGLWQKFIIFKSLILYMDVAVSVQCAIHIKQNIRSKMFRDWGIKTKLHCPPRQGTKGETVSQRLGYRPDVVMNPAWHPS